MTLGEALQSILYPQQLLLPFWNTEAVNEGHAVTAPNKTMTTVRVFHSPGFERRRKPKRKEKAPVSLRAHTHAKTRDRKARLGR